MDDAMVARAASEVQRSDSIDGGVRAAALPHRRIRVLLVISSLEAGGAERQVVHLANELNHRRFDVHVCSLSEQVPLAEGLNGRRERLHIVSRRRRFDVGVVLRVARLMRRLRIDVAHAFLFDAEMAARLAAQAAGVPVVVASERNADYTMSWSHRLGQRLTRHLFDVMVANSEAGRRFVVRAMNVAEDRVRVIRNGVDTERFEPGDRDAARRRLGLDRHRPVAGMVATFKRQKNHPVFLRAAAQVIKEIPKVQFVCVGEAMRDNQQGAEDYHREVCRLVDTLGLRDRCTFIGNQSDMPSVYNAFDVTVLSSLREGTPNVLLESMACGVPVVATDIADNRTVVPNGHAGFIVPPNDPARLAEGIGQLLADEDLRRRMGAWGRNWVAQRFSLRALADQFADLYSGLLRARRPVTGDVDGCASAEPLTT